jgi:hypothetical protein
MGLQVDRRVCHIQILMTFILAMKWMGLGGGGLERHTFISRLQPVSGPPNRRKWIESSLLSIQHLILQSHIFILWALHWFHAMNAENMFHLGDIKLQNRREVSSSEKLQRRGWCHEIILLGAPLTFIILPPLAERSFGRPVQARQAGVFVLIQYK